VHTLNNALKSRLQAPRTIETGYPYWSLLIHE
jgi:hypothetical protein